MMFMCKQWNRNFRQKCKSYNNIVIFLSIFVVYKLAYFMGSVYWLSGNWQFVLFLIRMKEPDRFWAVECEIHIMSVVKFSTSRLPIRIMMTKARVYWFIIAISLLGMQDLKAIRQITANDSPTLCSHRFIC